MLFRSYILTKKIYMPLNNIFDKIFSVAPPIKKNNQKTEVLGTLSDSISNIKEEFIKLNEFKRTNEFNVKNENLKSFLFHSASLAKTAYDYAFFNPTGPNEQFYLVCIFRLNGITAINSEVNYTDVFLYKYAFMNIAHELISQKFPCEFIDTGSDHITAIVNVGSNSDTQSEIYDIIQNIQDTYLSYFDKIGSAYISNPVQQLEDITSAYKSTFELSRYRLIYGVNCILFQESLDKLDLQTKIIASGEIKQIGRAHV